MKYLNHILIIAFCFLAIAETSAQTFRLRFETVTANGVDYEVDIYMAGSATFDLGSSNLQFTYDDSDMDNPSIVASEVTSLTGSPFYATTVSKPTTNKASINIFLFSSSLSPLVAISAHPTWTKLARLHFDVLDPTAVTNLQWTYNGATTETVVFMGDETTQIFAANSTDLEDLIGDPLPVELTSFDLETKDKYTIAEWTSETEIRFDGYELQRSADGNDFRKIAWIPGVGNSTRGGHYQYEDKDVIFNQDLYYRLRMIDNDETYKYSEIRVVRIDKEGIEDVRVFPNPTETFTKLSLETSLDGLALVQIFNTNGQLIKSFQEDVHKGMNTISLDVTDFPAGIYHIITQQGGKKHTSKLVKL